MPTPKPVVKRQVCSVCDLDWERHGEKPTVETCIELLKAEAKKPAPASWQSVNAYPQFYRQQGL